MKYVLFCQNNYAFGIFDPIRTYLIDCGHDFIWYVNEKTIKVIIWKGNIAKIKS